MSLYGGIQLTGMPDLENVRKLDLLPMRSIREIERYGFAIDIPHLNALTETLTKEMVELRRKICDQIPPDKLDLFMEKADMEDAIEVESDDPEDDSLKPEVNISFNVDSAHQVRKLLFDILDIGKGRSLKLTKSGDISTGKRQMEALKRGNTIVQDILDYRERSKLKGTYTEKFPKMAKLHPESTLLRPYCPVCGIKHWADTMRIHTQVLTTRTTTGRPACVAWWTKVLTNHGYRDMDLVRPGDLVWTHRHRWRKVLRTYIKGWSEMYNVTFSNGHVLTCTKDHRLLLLNHERFKKLDERTVKREERTEPLSSNGLLHDRTDRGEVGDDVPQRPLGSQAQDATGRIQGAVCNPLPEVEDGGEESDVWQDGRGPSQLDRRGGRWVRVSDLLEGWEEAVCPSYRDGGSLGVERATRDLRRASHRRGYEEQRLGQFGPDNDPRPQGNPQDDEGQSFVTIEKIESAGRFEVFDIEVEEDASYFAAGVFSHNTKAPNFQNIPIRSKHGREVRKGFIASPGTELVTVDFGQLELRILAHVARVAKMIEYFIRGLDVHTMTAMEAFDFTDPSQVDKLIHRAPAKNVNFAIVYGETPRGLLDQLVSDSYGKSGIEVPDWLTLEWCENFMEGKWHKIYPEVKPYMEAQYYRARRYGVVWSLFGRCRKVPEVRSEHKQIVAAGLRQAGNMPIQGCLPADTRVLTEHGWLKVSEWSGHRLWTGDGWANAKKIDKGEAQRLRLHLSDGRTFDCDNRHKLLVHGPVWHEWSHVDHIHGRELVRDHAPLNWGLADDHSVEDWYWAGRFVGDGCLRHGKLDSWSLCFSTKETKAIGEMARWLDTKNLRGGTNSTSGWGVNRRSGAITLRGNTQAGMELWESFGLGPKIRAFPPQVFRLDHERRFAFFQGYYDADGYHDPTPERRGGVAFNGRKYHKITSASRELLQDTLRLVQYFGLTGKIGTIKFRGRVWYEVRFHQTPAPLTVEHIEVLPVEPMFTFSVDHERHAFSSEGLISKNSGADMLKLAQPEIQDWIEGWLRPNDVWCWPVNEVHDELIFEVEEGLGNYVARKCVDVMSKVMFDKQTGENLFRVPIEADSKVAKRWEKG